ncbi:Regulator of RpoS [Sporomusa carbonis]|uniref:response regulator transcription factor n=1 Tax=Sporomusa carbonis TaxID=3076075 RepID=UPI003A6E6750
MYKVLIVDDDKTVRYMLKRFKKWDGYGFCIADEACDGKEALKKLSSGSFDLVITDIRMPGMTGIEFLHELKVRKMDICLILLSTYNDFEYAQQGIRLGVFDYMTKPVDDNILSEALERARKHLDEKKLLHLRLEKEKKLIDESLALYYPKSEEKKLVDLLFMGSDEVFAEAENIFSERVPRLDQDLFKIRMLFEKMTQNITEEIYKDFPWLEKIESMTLNIVFNHLKTIRDVKLAFLRYMRNMLEVIKKYELHHKDGIVKKTCQYVMDHVEENITLEDVANEVHVSKSYIGKLFKQKAGYNFTDYVTKVKMEHAKALLRTGDYKNYEVSERLGYSSPDYFCRLFKQYSGCTPLEFRKQGS